MSNTGPAKYTKKFRVRSNRDGLVNKLHPNRIVKVYEYVEEGTGETIYAVKYYRDTRRNREEFNFPPAPKPADVMPWDESDWAPEEGRDFGYPNEFWK